MKKIDDFKQLCTEMKQRKKLLDEEVDIYNQMANEILSLGGFVSFNNKITAPLGSISDDLKRKYESKFSQIYEHIQSQPLWISEINQAYKEAQDEILDYVRQKTKDENMVNHIQQIMEKTAQVNQLAAIGRGEQFISNI